MHIHAHTHTNFCMTVYIQFHFHHYLFGSVSPPEHKVVISTVAEVVCFMGGWYEVDNTPIHLPSFTKTWNSCFFFVLFCFSYQVFLFELLLNDQKKTSTFLLFTYRWKSKIDSGPFFSRSTHM